MEKQSNSNFEYSAPSGSASGFMNQPMARGLAGALIGGGAGALFSGGLAYGNKKENETPEARRRRIFRQALLGAGMGAPLGAAGGVFTTDTVSVKKPAEDGMFQGISDWWNKVNPSKDDSATTQAWLEDRDVTGRELVDEWNDLGVSAAGTAAGVGMAASTDVGSKSYHNRLIQLRQQVGNLGPLANYGRNHQAKNIGDQLMANLANARTRADSEQAATAIVNALRNTDNSTVNKNMRRVLFNNLKSKIAPGRELKDANKMYNFMRQVLGASDADAKAIISRYGPQLRPTNNRLFGTIQRHTALHNYLQPGERPIRDKLTGAKRIGAKGFWPILGGFGVNAARHKINERQYNAQDTKLNILQAIEDTMKSNGGDWAATKRTLEQQMPENAGLVSHMMGTLIKQLEGSK